MSIVTLYDDTCVSCELHKPALSVCLPGVGDVEHPRVVVVGDAPSLIEDEENTAFCDDSDPRAAILVRVLKEAGFDLDTIFATYAVKCFPRGSVKVTHVKTCRDEYLTEELNHLRPEMIIPLGKNAQIAVLNLNSPISKTHGKLFEYTGGGETDPWTANVVPVDHPFAVLSTPAKYTEWLSDFKRARAVLDGEGEPFYTPGKLSRFTFLLLDTLDKLEQAVSDCINNDDLEYLAFDVETSGLDDEIMRPGYKMYTIQFGLIDTNNKKNNDILPVYIVPYESAHFIHSDEWRLIVDRELIRLFSSDLKCVAHNAKFDQKVLWSKGIPVLSDRDTVILWANQYGEAPLSLKDIAYQVTDIGGYEVEMDKFFKEHGTFDAPPEVLLPYGGLDIIVVRHVMVHVMQGVMQEMTQ